MLPAEIFPYAHVVFRVITVLFALTVVTSIGVIISENRNPVKSLAWITVLILLPVVGFVLYLFFGRSMKNVRMISRRHRRRLRGNDRLPHIDENKLGISAQNRQLISLVHSLHGSHVTTGNDIEIFTTGKEKFEALFADIEAATEYIHLQYYIFERDNLGRRMSELLIAKARQGVKVRVIYDHVGSFHLNRSFFNRLRKNGVEAYPFLKVTFPELANHANWRNHRKVVVIDGKVGYIGGMNIADRYVDGNKLGPWRDTHLRIKGNAVGALQYSFAVDWNFMRHELLNVPLKHYEPAVTGNAMQLLMGGPTDRWSNIALAFLRAISCARQCVWVQTPYFLPNDSLLRALQAAALSGVDVRLMMPRRPDSKLLQFSSHSYIKECLQAGIKIYFYEPGMLHSKVIVVDDELVTTGSTNFDFRSFEHNFECNVFVYDKEFARRMKEVLEADERQSTRIYWSQWRRRPLWRKAIESIARLMSPLL